MDRTTEDIKTALELLAARHGPVQIQPAAVVSVQEDDTITVELKSGLVLDEIRLRSVVLEGDKIVLQPKVGSVVLIGPIENSTEYVVVAVGEITKATIRIGSTEFVQDEDRFSLTKDSDSLAGIIGDVITEISKIVVLSGTSPDVPALTQIQNRLNQMFA